MRKAFDSVQMMRDIREGLSRRYAGKPHLEMRELRAARKRFEARQAAAASVPQVAEGRPRYGSRGFLRMLNESVANLKKGLVSDPIDLSAPAEAPRPRRPQGKHRRSG